MKRGAERQLSKENSFSDEEIEPEEVPSTFKKADESTLATRNIRGLPKRVVAESVAGAVNGAATSEPQPAIPKFSGFSGFGAPSANSAFTFTTTTTKPASLTLQANSEQSKPSAAPAAGLVPMAVSTTATTTAKTLASFLGAPPNVPIAQKLASTAPATSLAFPLVKSPPLTTPSSMSPVSTSPITTESGTTANDPALQYYTDIRGLNVSLVSALSKAMLEDAFVDFSQVLHQYKDKRSSIQNDYERTKKSAAGDSEASKADTKKAKNPPSMPAPPSSFAFGEKAFTAPSFKAEESNSGGFKPTLSATTDTSSPFRFPSSTSAPPPESSSTLPNGASGTPAGGLPSVFTTSASAPSFGNVSKPDLPNPFKLPPSSSATSTGAMTSPFGTSNLFGPHPGPSPFAKPPSTASTFNTFGKPSGSGSIGNPVGFRFGANAGGSKESDSDPNVKPAAPSGFLFSQSSSPFGILASTKESKKTENGEGEGEGEGEEQSAGDDTAATAEGDNAAKAGISGPSSHDVEGEGEEEEETTHSIRLKAYRMRKADERGGQGWVELGVGFLRLKRHKESEARRMLLRNSSTGKININFKLYAGFKVTQVKKSLTFIGHDNGFAQTYNVRLPNEDQVRELREAIEREVALVEP